MAEPLRVVLVDDHRVVRSGVRAELLGDAPSGGSPVTVVGEAGDVESAVDVVTEQRPDVVLLDVHLPAGSAAAGPAAGSTAPGSAATPGRAAVGTSAGGAAPVGGAQVLLRCLGVRSLSGAPVRFLALSVSDAAEDVIAVIRAGARGYVTKTIGGDELREAVARVAGGDAVFSPRLAGFVLDAFAGAQPGVSGPDAGQPVDVAADDELDRLSAREREVMRLIARGYAYKEVARELFISVKTVETHVSAVLRKLQLSSRHELTRWAAQRHLL